MIKKEKILDSWLVMQTREGNKKALTMLVKRWHKKLCRQAYWYTNDMDAAKDIAQDCWPSIIKNLKKLKDTSSFGSWALSIVTRKSIDSLRKNKREKKHLEFYFESNNSRLVDKEDSTADGDAIGLLRASIQNLPVQQQLILNLFYLEELSLKQISEILDIPIGTVKSRLFNAREQLKLIIKNKDYEK